MQTCGAHMQAIASGSFELREDQKIVNRASPNTLALLFCNSLYDPKQSYNHWIPVQLSEQLGGYEAFQAILSEDRRKMMREQIQVQEEISEIVMREDLEPDEVDAMTASLEDQLTE